MTRTRTHILLALSVVSTLGTAYAADELGPETVPILVSPSGRIEGRVDQGDLVRLEPLVLTNTGGGTLLWEFATVPNWIVPDRQRGTLGAQDSDSIGLALDGRFLGPGMVRGEIVVLARNALGSPLTVPVVADINPDPGYLAPGSTVYLPHRLTLAAQWFRQPNMLAAGKIWDDNSWWGGEASWAFEPPERLPTLIRDDFHQSMIVRGAVAQRTLGDEDENWTGAVWGGDLRLGWPDVPVTLEAATRFGELESEAKNPDPFDLEDRRLSGRLRVFVRPHLCVGLLGRQEELDRVGAPGELETLAYGAFGQWYGTLLGRRVNVEVEARRIDYTAGDWDGTFSWDDTNYEARGWADYFFHNGFSLGVGGRWNFGDHPEAAGLGINFRTDYRFANNYSVGLEFGQFNRTENDTSLGGFPDDGSFFLLTLGAHLF
jgi:hypothetical protein